MSEIVFLDQMTLGENLDLSSLKEKNVKMYEFTSSEKVIPRCKNAKVIITNKVKLNESNLKELKFVEKIIITATGINNIDTDYTNKRGIKVINAVGYAAKSVPFNTFSMYFYLNHNLSHYEDFTKSLNWSKGRSFSYFTDYNDLSDQVWAVIGAGQIGMKVANLAALFGAEVLIYSKSKKENLLAGVRQVELEEALTKCNVLSVHCSLNEGTHHLLNEKSLSKIENCHTLLNFSRGEVIDEVALVDLLKRRNDIKVGLDVISSEPNIEDSPLIEQVNNKNLLITPHMSWASVEAREQLVKHIIDNL